MVAGSLASCAGAQIDKIRNKNRCENKFQQDIFLRTKDVGPWFNSGSDHLIFKDFAHFFASFFFGQ